MPVLFYRILFFALVPFGVYLLIKGIRQVRKCFYGDLLLELPYLDQAGLFEVKKAGIHSIWFKGQLYRRIPSDQFRPKIINSVTDEELVLSYSLLAPSITGFGDGRVEVLKFFALPGQYRIMLEEGSSVPKLLAVLFRFAKSIKPIDPAQFFIQVRESQTRILTFIGIPMILLGAGGIIGGIVLGSLAHEIF